MSTSAAVKFRVTSGSLSLILIREPLPKIIVKFLSTLRTDQSQVQRLLFSIKTPEAISTLMAALLRAILFQLINQRKYLAIHQFQSRLKKMQRKHIVLKVTILQSRMAHSVAVLVSKNIRRITPLLLLPLTLKVQNTL